MDLRRIAYRSILFTPAPAAEEVPLPPPANDNHFYHAPPSVLSYELSPPFHGDQPQLQPREEFTAATHRQDLTNLTLASSQGALLEGYLLVPEANVSRRFAHVLHQPCLLPSSDTGSHWSNCCKKRKSAPLHCSSSTCVPTVLLWGLRHPEPVKALECACSVLNRKSGPGKPQAN